jgi:hypothetical protein
LVLCSRNAHDQNVLVRRPHVGQYGCPPKRGGERAWKESGQTRWSPVLAQRAEFVCLVGWSFWSVWFFRMNFQSDQPNKPNRPNRPDEPDLVRRAQWKINQPPSPEERMGKLGRVGIAAWLSSVLVQRAVYPALPPILIRPGLSTTKLPVSCASAFSMKVTTVFGKVARKLAG